MTELIERLQRRLKYPLPGHDRFLELSGYKRPDLERARALEPPPRESAVLALLYPKQEVPHLLLMVRPVYAGVHSAQVSFPGGKWEDHDANLRATALREFEEETGASTRDVQVLGQLSPVYIPPSRMLVTPFVGHATSAGPWEPDPSEVARLLEVPLDLVLSDGCLKRRTQYIQLMGREVEIPYFDLCGEVVWGATAMMIAELRELLAPDPESGQ